MQNANAENTDNNNGTEQQDQQPDVPPPQPMPRQQSIPQAEDNNNNERLEMLYGKGRNVVENVGDAGVGTTDSESDIGGMCRRPPTRAGSTSAGAGGFYVSTTEVETEDTDIDAAAEHTQKQRQQQQQEMPPQPPPSPPLSNTTASAITTDTASLSVLNLLRTTAKTATASKHQAEKSAYGSGIPKDTTAAAAGAPQGRSISEVLRSKLASLPVREEGNFTLGFSKVFHTRTRFLMMVLCLFCLASIWSNILCFNFALICIAHDGDDGTTTAAAANGSAGAAEDAPMMLVDDQNGGVAVVEQGGNGTTTIGSAAVADIVNNGTTSQSTHKQQQPYQFTANQRLYLTSAVAVAALFANFVVVSLVNNYGIRTTFTCLGLLSALATCAIPSAMQLGFYYVLACRMLQGVSFAANFPVIGAFTSRWTYYKQNGLFVSALVAYVQFAPSITMPVSGSLCTTLGWPSVFFAHGGTCALLFTLWAVFYRNSPSKHPFVGEVELRKIAVGKTELNKKEQRNIPVREIVCTASVWAVWIAGFGNFVCVNMMFLYSPIYLHHVLKYPVAHTGFSASLAPLAQFGIKLFAGFTSDKIRFLSETNKLRLYNSVAFFGSALFLTMLAFFPTEYPTLCLMLLGLSAGLLGFTTGGFFKAGPLVAKHYALFVMGQISLAITVTLLCVPVMQNTLAPHNTVEEWRKVFLITAATLTLTNLAFCLMCSAKPAEWATDEFSRNASRHKIHSTEAMCQPKLGIPQTFG